MNYTTFDNGPQVIEPTHRSRDLEYFLRYPEDPWLTARPGRGFTVNGILYDRTFSGVCVRPMIGLPGVCGEPARMRYDKPPTEDEIDHWVRYEAWP